MHSKEIRIFKKKIHLVKVIIPKEKEEFQPQSQSWLCICLSITTIKESII